MSQRSSFTQKADWLFIIPATIVWVSAVSVTMWDFIFLQGMVFGLGLVNLVGIALVAGGIPLRILARMTLGRHFTHGLRILEGHILITHGIYMRVRHPGYTGALLIYLGTPLIFNSVFGFLSMFPPLAALILYRIRVEEGMLIGEFGDDYTEYMRPSWRLIPFLY